MDGTSALLQDLMEQVNQNTILQQENAEAIAKLQSQQVTDDVYYVNEEAIDIPKDAYKSLYTWTVKKGETMDFETKLDTDYGMRANSSVWLKLFENDRMVARSIDTGNGEKENVIETLFYRAKAMDEDVEYRLDIYSGGWDARIKPRHYHLAYTTYGPGHAWHLNDL